MIGSTPGASELVSFSAIDSNGVSAAELKARVEADRRGEQYLLFRQADGGQRIIELSNHRQLTIGRAPGCEVCIDWDTGVSRAHA